MTRILTRAGLLRLAAVGLLLAAGIVALVVATRPGDTPVADAPTVVASDPSTELERCRSLGEAAGNDPRCQAAWKASRDAFFGREADAEARP